MKTGINGTRHKGGWMLKAIRMFVSLLLFGITLPVAAGSLEATLALGNEKFEAGRYLEAVDEYEKIVRYGMKNHIVFYNLGNAWFKAGHLGKAILNYERGLRLAPRDEDLRHNIAYCRSLCLDSVQLAGENFYLRQLRRFRNLLTPDQSAFLFLGGWLLLSLAVFYVVFTDRDRRGVLGRVFFYLALLSLLVMFIAGTQYTLRWRHLTSDADAVVVAEKVDVASAPGTEYKLITPIHEGLKVRIVEEREGWYRIVIPQAGIGGWVPAGQVERV